MEAVTFVCFDSPHSHFLLHTRLAHTVCRVNGCLHCSRSLVWVKIFVAVRSLNACSMSSMDSSFGPHSLARTFQHTLFAGINIRRDGQLHCAYLCVSVMQGITSRELCEAALGMCIAHIHTLSRISAALCTRPFLQGSTFTGDANFNVRTPACLPCRGSPAANRARL
jgi:hypothetical protein